MKINGQTRLTGLLGDPILYSKSPAMHNAAYTHLQLNYVYLPLHVASEHVAAAMQAIRAFGMVGVNVTVPHKEAVIPYLDYLDQTASSCGAVNTIIHHDGELYGYNTDGQGFLDSLADEGFKPAGVHAVILGAGGSARAVAFALQKAGAAAITLINRTETKATELANMLKEHTDSHCEIKTLPLIPHTAPDMAKTSLVVNTLATPFQTEGQWLLDLQAAGGALFYDLRYGSMPSAFLDYARELHCRAVDGLGMLLHQGARAFTLFTGISAPIEVMKNALLK